MTRALIAMDSFGFHIIFRTQVRGHAPIEIRIPCNSLEHATAVAAAFNGEKK